MMIFNYFPLKLYILLIYFIISCLAEVRQEAVQQALAALKTRPKTNLPMPSKRCSVLNRSPDRNKDDSGKLFQFIYFKEVLN